MNCLGRGEGRSREGREGEAVHEPFEQGVAIDCFEHLFSRASLLDKDTLAVQMAKSFENMMC